jgi:hypothetical protein
MKNTIVSFFTTAAIFFILTSMAYADGEARKATQTERDFYKKVMTAIMGSIPPGPAAWSEEKGELDELESVGVESEKYPFRIDYHASWTDYTRKDAADQAIQEALMPIMMKAANNPETQKLFKENEKLATQFGEAISKNDQAKTRQLGKEMEILRAKMEVITKAQDKETDDAMEKLSARDVKASINIYVNSLSESFYESIKQDAAVNGCQTFRSEGEWSKNNGWSEGTTYVFMGKGWQFKSDGSKYVETKAQPGIPSTAVQTIVVRVQADPARAKQILQKIDWKTLNALIR